MNNQCSRQNWADYTKAFAIWLMVLCHFGLRPASLVKFIFVFHMPVFFVISGYFDKGDSFSWALLKKSFKKVMIPYFFFSLCSFSICWISPYLHPEIYHNGTIPQTFVKAFIGMFLMEDLVRPYAFMPTGALWFLVALFNIKILFSLLILCWAKCRILIIGLVSLIVLIVLIKFPFFSIDSACLSLPFYIIGYFFKRYKFLDRVTSRMGMLSLSAVCFAYVAIIGVRNGYISIDGCTVGNNIILFYINGTIGSLACIYFFRFADFENKYLQKIGSSTLTILGSHGYVNKAATIVGVLLLGVSPSEIPLWYIIGASFIALFFGVWVEKLLSRYCPKMIGKTK